MKTRFLVLRPALPLTPRIKIEIPSRMEVVPTRPRLTGTGAVKVNIAAVHDGGASLSIRSMLKRARKLTESPVENLEDLENILTRSLSVNCDYLVTGVRLRRRFGPFTFEYVLYLSPLANRWIAHFFWFSLFNDSSRVLCYGK